MMKGGLVGGDDVLTEGGFGSKSCEVVGVVLRTATDWAVKAVNDDYCVVPRRPRLP